jgi:protein phosphatase
VTDEPLPADALVVPPDALVVLVGAAGSGKSTMAARLFAPSQVLSSDMYRAAVSGDATDQSATKQAFRRLHATLERRMAAGDLTVIDATNVQGWARRRLLAVAGRHGRPTVAVVLALPVEVSLARNAGRTEGRVPSSAVRRQDAYLQASLAQLGGEGYASLVVLTEPDQVERLAVRHEFGTQRNVPKERHPAL